MLLQTVFIRFISPIFHLLYGTFFSYQYPRPMECTEILVQCLEEMCARSRLALPCKSEVFGEPGEKKEYIHPSRQEGPSFKALPGL